MKKISKKMYQFFFVLFSGQQMSISGHNLSQNAKKKLFMFQEPYIDFFFFRSFSVTEMFILPL